MALQVPKPDKFVHGGNFTRFLEKFTGFVTLTKTAENLDLLLLSMVDNHTYGKLSTVKMEADKTNDIKEVIQFYTQRMAAQEDTRSLQAQLMMCSQQDMETVDEYSVRLDDLACRAYTDDDVRKSIKVPTFLRGIRDYKIKLALIQGDKQDYDDLVKTAKRCEQASTIMEGARGGRLCATGIEKPNPLLEQGSGNSGVRETFAATQQRYNPSRAQVQLRPTVRLQAQPQGMERSGGCWTCGDLSHQQKDCKTVICWNCTENHFRKDCPYKREGPRSPNKAPLVCAYCNRAGHLINFCWKRQGDLGLNTGVRQEKGAGRTPN